MRLLCSKNFLSGILFVAIGIAAIVFSSENSIGTASRMGSRFFPLLLAGGLIVLGSGLSAYATFFAGDDRVYMGKMTPLVLITLGILLFGILLEHAGLVISIFVLVFVSKLADQRVRPKEVLILSVSMSVFSWLVFVYQLSLPIPVWPI